MLLEQSTEKQLYKRYNCTFVIYFAALHTFIIPNVLHNVENPERPVPMTS